MDITHTIALTMGVAWASGINLYATLLVLGYMGMTGNIDLPPDLQILMDPMVMIAAGLMYCMEFFHDSSSAGGARHPKRIAKASMIFFSIWFEKTSFENSARDAE